MCVRELGAVVSWGDLLQQSGCKRMHNWMCGGSVKLHTGSDVGHRIVGVTGITGGIPDPMWTRPVDLKFGQVLYSGAGASLSQGWGPEATYRVGQGPVRDLRSGADHVSQAGSVISGGFGTLIRHEFLADPRSGLDRCHGMIASWGVSRICVVAEIPCGYGLRG